MSVVMMIDNPNGSPELYARMVEHLHPPVGGIAHIAGPGPEGGWRVLEVWDSEDEARRFLRERFAPALRAAGAGTAARHAALAGARDGVLRAAGRDGADAARGGVT